MFDQRNERGYGFSRKDKWCFHPYLKLSPEEAFAIFLQKYYHVRYEEENYSSSRKKTGTVAALIDSLPLMILQGFMSTEEYDRLVEIAGCDPSTGGSLYTINNGHTIISIV